MSKKTNLNGCFYVVLCVAVFVPVSSVAEDVVRVKRSKPRQCRDKFEILRNHTMCISQATVPRNKSLETTLEHLHNSVRQKVLPPAASMMTIGYARPLAIEAQTWADNCQFHHDDPYKRFIPGRYHVGQNILTSTGKDLSWSDVIATWASENRTFHYNKTGNRRASVGNYIQLVWAETILVGCGKALCSGTYFYVCNYAPSMDVNKLNTPYQKAAAGLSAGHGCNGHYATGTKGLCDCYGKYCINGGTLNLHTCNCTCVPGVRTYNVTKECELKCDANGDHSSCGSLTKSSCTRDPNTVFLCPWLCDVCPYAGLFYREGSVRMPWETTTAKYMTTRQRTTTANNVTKGLRRNSASTMVSSVAYITILFIKMHVFV